MNPELKVKWVDALRSGKYIQGTGKLHYRDSYCCMGVLCDIMDPSKWEKRNDDSDTHHYRSCTGALCGEVFDETGLLADQQRKLIAMNDNDKSSFAEIANYIEKEL